MPPRFVRAVPGAELPGAVLPVMLIVVRSGIAPAALDKPDLHVNAPVSARAVPQRSCAAV
jgi:hypothetical protein